MKPLKQSMIFFKEQISSNDDKEILNICQAILDNHDDWKMY